ncbi:MAG: hypothetical protein M4579_005248 [Chaenotheca gracillima]|nr:MAG: hypothetical protein M4579_005248 [Chaenotheca gracillima]
MPETSLSNSQTSEQRSEEHAQEGPEYGENIDAMTFEQILEMDEDDPTQEFSRSIVFGFFEQAESTFAQMNDDIEKRDLNNLSALGHFLKGSSATLGLTKVKDSCEKIQHLGAGKEETGQHQEPDEDKLLARIKEILGEVISDYRDAERSLKAFYARPAQS